MRFVLESSCHLSLLDTYLLDCCGSWGHTVALVGWLASPCWWSRKRKKDARTRYQAAKVVFMMLALQISLVSYPTVMKRNSSPVSLKLLYEPFQTSFFFFRSTHTLLKYTMNRPLGSMGGQQNSGMSLQEQQTIKMMQGAMESCVVKTAMSGVAGKEKKAAYSRPSTDTHISRLWYGCSIRSFHVLF